MNESTNPAGIYSQIQAAGLPAGTIPGITPLSENTCVFPHIRRQDNLSGIAGGKPSPKNSLIRGFIRNNKYTPEQRRATADIMNAHLLMVEIMLSNIAQKYIYAVSSELKEKGLVRHNIKRRIKELTDVSTDLMKRCNANDREQVIVFTKTIYPSLSEDFLQAGGTLTQKLQGLFWKKYGEQINIIYFATKNALDKCRVKNSALVANVEMISMVCATGMEFYNYMCRKVDSLMFGIGKVERVKSQHNEKMMAATRELLRELVGDIPLPEKEAKDVRTLTSGFQHELVSQELLTLVESSITAMQMEFIEFVIATLRIKIARRSMTLPDYRMLFCRLGTRMNVQRLLVDIARIPYEEKEDTDIFDLMETFPESGPNTVLSEFRRLCLEDHIVIPQETKMEKTLRKLRQHVYRNGGQLDMLVLRYLYSVFGTKKAVTEYLAQAGKEVMGKTLNSLRNIKASQLKLDAGKNYALNPGHGLRTLYQMHGYTRERFASEAHVKTDCILELEAMGDLSHVPNIPKVLTPLVSDVSKILGEDPRFYLFASLQETEQGGMPMEAYQELFREMEALYNDNQNEENGKEKEKTE